MIVDGNISAYLNSLEEGITKELINLEQEALKNHIPIIKKETQNLLKFLLRTKKPQNILEVGTAIGFSALFISEYCPKNTKITTIEKLPIRINEAKKNFSDTKFNHRDKIRLLEGDALDVLEELRQKKEMYDFIFLDAAKAQYMNFLTIILDLLEWEGTLVTDNVLQDGLVAQSRFNVPRRDRTIHNRMREYLYTIKHSEELETVILPIGDGVSISDKQMRCKIDKD